MKTWMEEDVDYLERNWGEIPLPSIAKKLDRTVNAIKLKARKLGLKRHLHSGKDITFCQLCKTLGQFVNYQQHKKSWIRHGLPVKYKTSIHKKFMMIRIDEFWDWAETHKNLLDFSKFEENMLGKEPQWVAAKRYADMKALKYKTTPWTKAEDKYLISLLSEFRYGYRELAVRLQRTEGAIKKRINTLGLRQRPVKADNHTPWEKEDIETIKKLHFAGYEPDVIAGFVERSACAVRGLLERLAARNELNPPKPKKRNSYQKALPEELWPKAERFLKVMNCARSYVAKTGQRPDLDLGKLRNAFAGIEGRMTI